MKYFTIAVLVLLLAGCGEKPAPKIEKKAPEVAKVEPKPVEVPKLEAPKPDPNKVLAQEVKRALEKDAKIQADAIDVTAANGAVTLWGTAASEEEKRRAAQAAAKVAGVKSVDNRVQVVRGS